jgi:hypothetical protein
MMPREQAGGRFTRKGRMLAAIRGEALDRLPWAPRLDLWYRANRLAGTLPEKYRDASLVEMVDDMDIGYHAVVPDFQALATPEDDVDRALGIYNLEMMPCRTVLGNVGRRVRREGDRTFVEYQTPRGTVSTTVLYDERMRKAGITITHVEEYAFKGEQDYGALRWIFENASAQPNPGGYCEFADRVGERGVAVGFLSAAASGMHLVQRELMPLDLFFYEMHDHPGELLALAGAIDAYLGRVVDAALSSTAEVLFLGANYDASVTTPPFFRDHIGPGLRAAAEKMHARGKHLLTHTDGENTGLLQHYLDARFDIADSICPAPMTKLSFRQVRDAFGSAVTIMGGIPSIALLPSSMGDREFDAFIEDFFGQVGSGRNLIMGISDTTPPAASFERLARLAERVREFGPVT